MRSGAPIEAAFRSVMSVFKATVNSVDDKHMMQETSIDGHHSHKRKVVEAPQNYGFSSVAAKRDGKQGKGGGYGNDDEGGEAAEAVMIQAAGYTHMVAVVMDDRRHRPWNMPAGSSAQYGPNTEYGRSMTYIKPTPSDDSKSGGGASAATTASGGGGSEEYGVFMAVPHPKEFVSMRHINQKKQPKPKSKDDQQQQQQGTGTGPSGGGGIAGAPFAAASGDASSGSGDSGDDYNHEKGQGINTEVRCTKDRIEFRIGDDVVGYYDKGNKRWSFTGEMRLGSDDASHPVYGLNNGKGMTTEAKGDGAVLVNAPQPGPPTSLDKEV